MMNQTKKHTTGKKLLALLLALIMTVSLLPMSVFAAELDAEETPVVEDQPQQDAEPAQEPDADSGEEDVDVTGDGEDADTQAMEDEVAVQAITLGTKPADGTTTSQPFASGTGSSNSFRIPALVTMSDGTLVASADARWNQAQDGGGNDTIVAYSSDNGDNWGYTFANYLGDNGNVHNDKSTCFIDSALAVKGDTVYMLVDLFSHGRATVKQSGRADASLVAGSGFTSEGYLKLSADTTTYLTSQNDYSYYLKDGFIYDEDDNKVNGYSVDAYFNIYKDNSYISNLFFADSPYRVYPTGYLYLTKSTTGGKSWEAPTLLNVGTAFDGETACITGPGRGLVTSSGTIIFPVYGFKSGTMKVGFVYSNDNGATWTRSNSSFSSSESDIVELSDGTLRVFYRTSSGSGIHYVDVKKNGSTYEWGTQKTVSGAASYSDCQLSAIKYSKTVGGHETIIVSCPTNSRTTGYLYLLDASTMKVLASSKVNSDNYQYSCLTELSDGRIGLLYETHANRADIEGAISYATFDLSEIFSSVEFDPEKTPEESSTPITANGVTVTFDDPAVKGMDVANATVDSLETDYVAYNVTPNDPYDASGDKAGATVTLPLGDLAGYPEEQLYGFYVENGKVVKATDGKKNDDGTTYTFTVPHFSVVGVAAYAADAVDATSVRVAVGQTVEVFVEDYEATPDASGTYVDPDGHFTATWKPYTREATTSFTEVPMIVENNASKFSIDPGKYYIGDGYGNFLMLNNGVLENTTDIGEATEWNFAEYTTVTGAGSRTYTTYKVSSDNYYLTRNSTTLTTTSSSSSATDWLYSYGIFDLTSSTWGQTTTYTYYFPTYTDTWGIVSGANTVVTDTAAKAYTKADVPAVSGTMFTFTGVSEVTDEPAAVGGKNFSVTVYTRSSVPEYQDAISVAVGETKTVSLPEALGVGETVVWSMSDGSYAGVYSTNSVEATVVGRAVTTSAVTLTATVYAADGKTKLATYTWTVTVTTGSTSGNVTFTFPAQTIYNGTLYYSIDGGPLQEVPVDDSKTTGDGYGGNIYTTEAVTAPYKTGSQIEFFIKPDTGYALTYGVGYSNNSTYDIQFYALDKEQFRIKTRPGHQGTTPEDWLGLDVSKAMVADAVSKGCDGLFWYTQSSGTSRTINKHTIYCDKLPTVAKEVVGLWTGKETLPYDENNSWIADAGNQVIFKIKVTTYHETVDIDYTNGWLIDAMNKGDVTLYSDYNATTGPNSNNVIGSNNRYNVTTVLDASRTSYSGEGQEHTYYAAYMLTKADLSQTDEQLVNMVYLRYRYQSRYSSGSYASEGKADAKVKLTDVSIPDIVIDFGLPVEIEIKPWATNHEEFGVKSWKAQYGTISNLTGTNKKGVSFIYTPNKDMVREIDIVELTSDRDNISTFRVIPASTVYYEDDFVNFKNADGTDGPVAGNAIGNWYTDGTKNENATQALDKLGDASANNYGYDATYAECSEFSLGSAVKVTVDGKLDEDPTATFTFKGTGFDIISLTNNKSGAIYVDVYKGDEVNEDNFKKGYVVNNYYGYAYEDGAWKAVDSGDENAIYQVPVIKASGYPYGVYTVQISVSYSPYQDAANKEQYSFWMDAVRVYDPAGDINEDYYKQDGEQNPDFVELRNVLLDAGSFDGSDVTGAVFIDGRSSVGTADIEDYKNYGPNHEVYLAAGQAIAFQLVANAKPAGLQLGAKLANGDSAELTVTGAKIKKDNAATNDAVNTLTLATATDMFYTLDVEWKQNGDLWKSPVITLTNSSDSSGMVSLTNLKFIDAKYTKSVDAVTNAAEGQVLVTMMMDADAAQEAIAAVDSVLHPQEVKTFEPERFEASWNRSTVKVGQKATLTVKTSTDVDAITVDGVTVTNYRTRTQRTGWGWNATKVTYREFTYTVTAAEAGTLDYSVVAINADSVSSEPITAALTVQAAAQRPGIGGWLDNIFGRWF